MNARVKRIATHGIMTALILVGLLLPGFGIVSLAVLPIIAVCVTSITLGIVDGLISAFTFALISFISGFIGATPFAQVFVNPLISVLPRLLLAPVAYFSYKLIAQNSENRARKYTALTVAGILTCVVNTAGVVGMLLAFHFGTTFGDIVIGWEWLTVLLLTNFVIEVIICAIVCPPLILALASFLKRNTHAQDYKK
ncbi:MAG: ECF transporter S component [Christensenellaceae bacterium]|jgi:uncharacterized membrane protein|nr:ECF transporter S component [Christensenellaceae bacterium]